MEKEDRGISPSRVNELLIKTGPNIDYEKILVYVGIISFLITFWQGWRDIHKDMSEIKERVAIIETTLEIKKASIKK